MIEGVQGVQTRTFAYNSLSRLTSATNPESGTINYVYDNNGNLTSKTDARGVKTDYIYDALNRVTNRNYSTPNGTPGTGILANYQPSPNVTYFYDGTNVAGGIPNSKGKLTKVASSVSTTEYMAFDILGRVTRSKQTTDGVEYGGGTDPTKWMTYVYNLSGALIEQQYPSGRVVRNTLDTDGSLQQVQSRRANDTFRNYANGFTYTAAGAVTALRLGNGKWETTQFNSRLQPTQIGLGTSATNQGLLKLNYDYGTTDNNGNVKSQTITVPTVGANQGFTAVQAYSYDSLNRLKSATENINGNQTPNWKQTFTFDRYGNRRFDEANTTTIPSGCSTAVCNPQIDPSTNKLIGYVFDTAGNTTTDANGQVFTYDSENKQVKVHNGSTTIGEYFYDGDGKRVKKVVLSTGETTIFVYDASGKSIVEYSTIVANSTDAKASYLTLDHLGSPRINTDQNGAVIARHDYHPFGEEIATSQRTAVFMYAPDFIRKKFTGYQRDNESSQDFAAARSYSSSRGRFLQADPYNIIFEKERGRDKKERTKIFLQFVSQSQNWNRYSYVINNPTIYVDPLGLKYLSANGIIYYVADEIYRMKGFNEWFEGKYGKYSIVPDGTKVDIGPRATGMFEKYRGQTVILGPRGLLIPVTNNNSMETQAEPTHENNSVSARETAWIRTPDFYQAEADILQIAGVGGLAVQGTVDCSGQTYFGVGGYLGLPGVNVSGGYLPQRYRAYPFETENFLTGASVGGYVGGLGGTYSNNGQFAPQIGTTSLPSISATYCFRFDLPYQP